MPFSLLFVSKKIRLYHHVSVPTASIRLNVLYSLMLSIVVEVSAFYSGLPADCPLFHIDNFQTFTLDFSIYVVVCQSLGVSSNSIGFRRTQSFYDFITASFFVFAKSGV